MTSTSLARHAHSALLGLFFGLLLWLPLPMASNRPWAVGFLAAASAVLLAAVLLVRAWTGHEQHEGAQAVWRAKWPLALLLGYTLWVLVQWQAGWSADPFETRQYLLRCQAYVSLFLLVILLVDNDRRRLMLFTVLVASGLLQALLAIGLLAANARYDFVGTLVHHSGRAQGTFASPDHLSNFLLLSLAAGLGLMLARLGQSKPVQRPSGWRGAVHAALEFGLSTKMLLRLVLVVLVIALVLTRSRMGNGTFFVSLFIVSAWVMVVSPRLRRPAAWLVASLLVVDLIVIGQWVGLDKVVRRLEATEIVADRAASSATAASGSSAHAAAAPVILHYREESLAERIRPAVDAWKLVAQRPWTGWGGGTFTTVYPNVKRPEIPVRFDHAHNDYIEILSDTGLVGLALLGGVWLSTLLRAARLMQDDQPPIQRGLATGGVMAMVCALLHALVDFNLQLPANAGMLTVLLAATWGLPRVGESGARRRRRGSATV